MSPLLFPLITVVALAIFGWQMSSRARLLLAARSANRFDHIGQRLRRTAVYAFGQRKFITGEQPAGIMHMAIFWGFMVLGLQVVTLFGRAFDEHFDIPLLGPGDLLEQPFFLLRDLLEVSVLLAVGYALYRWLVKHTKRLYGYEPAERRLAGESHGEAILILAFISFIMIGGLLHDASHAIERGAVADLDLGFATWLVAQAIDGLSPETLGEIGWWLHNLTVLTFLNLLPGSKHFHIITAIPNVFFGKSGPYGALPKPAAREGAPGIAAIEEFDWKQVLDMYSCTECGRCTAACPATASGSPLAPRQLILDMRDHLYERIDGENGQVIADDVLWSCTTCMACVEACPVGIEHVPTIIDMRRRLVDEGRMEPMLQQTLESFAKQGNSYGKSSRMRSRWTKGLDFKIPDARKEPVERLWFVGDFASFDERSQDASRRIARILHSAGVSFGMLYDGERNSGNDVRRIGEEGLYELLVEHNLNAFAEAEFESIFTTDPHSLNTLRNEYPDFGEMKPVLHYTELLVELLDRGELTVREPVSARVTYHDPCYLARYNRVTDAPRKLLAATGAELVEMPRNGTNTFCCGAGGGRIWMDDSQLAERPSEQRIREAMELGDLDAFVVTCPKDLAMYSDAAKTVGAPFEVLEVTALLERALLGDAVTVEEAAV